MPDKWAQTGWRIEQRYANKVLLGNWAEERLQFTREPQTASSASRVDYQPHWDFKPDVCERRSALLRAEGLPSKLLFAHRGAPSSDCSRTNYEESYALPTLHPWHSERLTSDPPVSVLPTSFGTLRSTKHHLEKQQSQLPSLTVYRSAYQRHPLDALCQSRFARASRTLSSHLHAANHHNKDLDLRRRSHLQVPDRCFGLLTPPKQALRSMH
ncbi:cilia- and flagella-associated protein 107 [Channa argus]|uniref:cilia- and flagella-associated protein 107 n=1 Tax=Channa argus TaxID=215402 RepID=UPI003521A154